MNYPAASAPPTAGLRVAIVHYWFVGMRGGEKVIEQLLQIYPDATIYTHVVDPATLSERIARQRIETTLIAKIPGARRHYQKLVALMPLALEQLDLSDYDLVISSESGPAKGVLVRPDATHVCYCHSPMRYLWDMYHEYRAAAPWWMRWAMPLVTHRMRIWDALSADRVDQFVANSRFIAQRIHRVYRRDAVVVHPPVDVDRFAVSPGHDDFYLLFGQLTAYKRPQLAVQACNDTGRRLVVIGGGEMEAQLRKLAGPTVEIMGRQPDDVVTDYLQRCRALIFPGQEDFGIVPVEAMACGKPVIAYGRGGVLDSVIPGSTGVFFDRQTPDALVTAISEFEEIEQSFDAQRIAEHAAQFSNRRFRDGMTEVIESLVAGKP